MKDSILSTKLLTLVQQELVLNTGLSLTHYDILKTESIPYDFIGQTNHVIITSQNAIPALLKMEEPINKVSCVGEITAALLMKNGISPLEIVANAKELGSQLIANYPKDHFTYLCSEQRRDELPAIFLHYKIPLKEVFVYRSIAVEKSFDRIFAAVLFYSPRGVHAFAKANPKSTLSKAICIGETTATAARVYFKKIHIARKTTIENTLVTAIKAINND